MLLTIDGTFLVQIINFVIFWTLLNWLFIGPTRRAIEERQRRIASIYKETDEFAEEARRLQAQADAILDEARRTIDETMRAAASRASDEGHAIERKATDEAAAIVALAQATVAAERAQAVAKQGPFVDELAQTMAQRAIAIEQTS